MPAKITLDVYNNRNKQGIDAELLLKALDASLEVLRELDSAISGGKCEWRYTYLAVGSGLSVIEGKIPQTEDGPELVAGLERELESLYVDGLVALDANPIMPTGFTTRAVEALLRLGSIISNDIVRIETSAGASKPVTITERIIANVKEVLGRNFTDLGSVEGRLETISLAGRPTFNVRDEITGHSVVCALMEGSLEEVKSALGKRVLVSGEVTYSRRGEASEVSPVHTLLVFGDAPIPTVEDIRGLESNITEGTPSGLYM